MPRGLKCKNSKMPAKINENFIVNLFHLFWRLNEKDLQWNFFFLNSISKKLLSTYVKDRYFTEISKNN